jgi:uncharacterized protein (DUF2267 family)
MIAGEVDSMIDSSKILDRVSDTLALLHARRREVTLGMRRRVRRVRSRLHGTVARLGYERTYGHPALDVPSDVLADRIRSSLGPLERKLDLPHVHVTVEGKTALLHGDVATPKDAAIIEAHVAAMPGVVAVDSRLHVGLLPSDARPSSGRAVHPASPALQALQAAAVRGGADVVHARDAVSAVLSVFVRRLPPGEAHHVEGHLPSDVRQLIRATKRSADLRARTVDELKWQIVVQSDHLTPDRADAVMRGVLSTLRQLVPEEAADVTMVLPQALRCLWQTAEDPTTTSLKRSLSSEGPPGSDDL